MATDPDFMGSIFEAVGLTAELCSHCQTHLPESGVCLNGCTLPGYLYRQLMNPELYVLSAHPLIQQEGMDNEEIQVMR